MINKWYCSLLMILCLLIHPNDLLARSFKSQLINLQFQQIPVRSALQLLAKIGRVNLLVSNGVTGQITLNLHQVDWHKALQLIVTSQNLVQQRINQTLIIKTQAEVVEQRAKKFKQQLELNDEQALMTQLILLKNTSAKQIAEIIRSAPTLLSKQGRLSVDQQNNRLILQDKPEQLKQLQQLIHQLDTPRQEVNIQARIMNMDRQYEQSLGVRFGITQPNRVSGTLVGANQMMHHALQGSVNPVADVPLNQRLNIDLPAGLEGIVQAPSMGIALAKLGKGTLLDLELSAVEAEGGGKLLSAPHLVTANMTPAYIEAGEEIPYEESTSSGATAASFKKAVLGLRVTPQILAHHRILLSIKVNQDKRSNEIVKGEPAIDTRQISTQVVVMDGQTVVLGGIIETGDRHQEVRVPFLSDIPILGELFKSSFKQSEEQELLVFITPTTVVS